MSSLDENKKTSKEVEGLMTDGWCRMGGALPHYWIASFVSQLFCFYPSFMVAKGTSSFSEGKSLPLVLAVWWLSELLA